MAFPQSILPIKVEFLIAGVWTDVTSRVRLHDLITLSRGFRNEQGNAVTPDTASFTLNNRDGLFSNRNPNSIYYGLLARNTQCRISVVETAVSAFFREQNVVADGGVISTTDKAVLDIVGDLDVRVDVAPFSWRPGAPLTLAAKYAITGNQRSWLFWIGSTGLLNFQWSADGTNFLGPVIATDVIPNSSQRLSLKVTIDVDNGAAGNTVTFSYATAIGGSYTAIGSAIVTAGVTSIFNSTTPLTIGNRSDMGTEVFTPFIGKFYSAEIRNGIAGTLVAKMDAGAQAAGTTSWSDGLGTPNTWTVTGATELILDNRRFWGEISEFPQRWDTSGNDVYVPMTAASILRRLGAGQSPVFSPLLQYWSSKTTTTAYHPLEAGNGAYTAQVNPALLNDVSFTVDPALLGSSGNAVMNSAASTASAIAKVTADATYASMIIYFKYPALPAAETTLVTVLGSGLVPVWKITVSPTNFRIIAYDNANNLLNSQASTFGTNVLPTNWVAMRLQIHTAGGFIYMEMSWFQVGDTTQWGFSSTNFLSGTFVGRFTGWRTDGVGDNTGLSIAHAIIQQQDYNTPDGGQFALSSNGFQGERAGARFARLCDNANIDGVTVGGTLNTVTMDRQSPGKLIDLLQECCDADGGFFLSARTFNGVLMRPRQSLYGQPVSAALIYQSGTTNHLSGVLEPTDDDQLSRNDVTVTMPLGGFGRAEIVSPRMNNVSTPDVDPKGIGRYDTSYPLNLNGTSEAVRMAEFATYLGTWDSLRYPVVKVELARSIWVSSAALTAAMEALNIGDPVSIANLPAWLPPDTVELLVRGITEVLENRGWTFTLNTQPYGPFRGVSNGTSQSTFSMRAGASNTTVQTGFTNSATSFTVQTPTGSKWSTSPSGVLQVNIAGEVITVGTVGAAAGANQTFSGCTRSVNGIVKAHLVNEDVQIHDPFYAAQ